MSPGAQWAIAGGVFLAGAAGAYYLYQNAQIKAQTAAGIANQNNAVSQQYQYAALQQLQSSTSYYGSPYQSSASNAVAPPPASATGAVGNANATPG